MEKYLVAVPSSNDARDRETRRLEVLDVLRGVSLIGIPIINSSSILRLNIDTDLSLSIYKWTELLFRGHFFPIFSMLFGVTAGMLLMRTRQRGQPASRIFLRRLGIMALFGIFHRLLQPGEVLLPYAIFGLLLIPFDYLPLKFVLISSLIFTLLALCTTPILLTPAMFLLGLSLQRAQIFEKSNRIQPTLRWLFPFLTLLAATLTVWTYARGPQADALLPVAGFAFDLNTLTGLVGAGALTTGVWFLVRNYKHLPAYLRPLSFLGRMSLSNYILQTLVFALLGWLGWREGPFWLIIPACLIAYAFNFIFSKLWLKHHQSGPLEWLWRWGTTGKRPENI
ncbi:hypothetical protein Dcar01_02783 [Deinococcus carri]|uniref:DUF418 domain-containing protein n=1 Tax=Deinococcus carri TaxID=1211323 RepID=A0ABP9W9L3_9DEIO